MISLHFDSRHDQWPLPLMAIFLGTASFMAVYEAVKQFGFPQISILQSHVVTVVLAAAVATGLSAALLVRYRLGMLIYEISSDAIMVTDHLNRVVDVNQAFTDITGYTLDEMKGMTPAVLSQGPLEKFFRASWEGLMTNDGWSGEFWSKRKSGDEYALSGSVHVIRQPGGAVFRHVVQFSDITERKRSEDELRKREADARSLSESLGTTFNELYSIVEANPDILYVINGEGMLVKWNRNFEKFCGLEPGQMLNRKVTDFVYEEDRKDLQMGVTNAFRKHYSTFEVRFVRYDGVLVPYWCNGVVLTKPNGEMVGITGTGRDVSERKRKEDRIVELATHDTLTGLPNRMLFSDRLQQALATGRRERSRLAIMFVDLDKFKPVNDGHGHDMGDELLREVAKRMRNSVRESDVAARIGGDEFLVLLASIEEPRHALEVANKVREAIGRPVSYGNDSVQVSASIGLSIFPDDASDENALIKNADIAMYHAKEKGGNIVRFYGQ